MTSDGLGNAGLVAVLAIVPLVILMLTSFVKISVVLSLVRNAIGAPDAPSGLVVMGLSLVLTFFVMAPVAVEMVQAAATTPAAGSTAPVTSELERAVRTLVPAERQADVDAAARAVVPLTRFLSKHAAPKDRATFIELAARMGRPATGDELWVLAPAFLTTELREAFAIAVLIFLPFLVIDLLVALGLASLGLATTSPQVVALPLKLLLFVAVDGWRLLVESLLRGYV
ncbi:MAG: EscR/YscR/HrcR family type III secretion system export apparatus protein [Myxococcales bacterium]|nr:EscR/YscR/HrcR family type III secretion system export apparatus protein [Myxococcales bacterium]